MDVRLYDRAAKEAFPEYNVKNMISLEMSDGSGKVQFHAAYHDPLHLYIDCLILPFYPNHVCDSELPKNIQCSHCPWIDT